MYSVYGKGMENNNDDGEIVWAATTDLVIINY